MVKDCYRYTEFGPVLTTCRYGKPYAKKYTIVILGPLCILKFRQATAGMVKHVKNTQI